MQMKHIRFAQLSEQMYSLTFDSRLEYLQQTPVGEVVEENDYYNYCCSGFALSLWDYSRLQ